MNCMGGVELQRAYRNDIMEAGVIDATHARGKVLRASMRIDVDRTALIS